MRPAIYDGDTPAEQRARIRGWANAILTNPDMLHLGVLPNHGRWADVLHTLRFVVVDEAHVYRGVFGSHVANVLRRLLRLAGVYGATPQVVLASATIANPAELAESLTGRPATVVDNDAAPRADREIALWNPPLVDAELGLRASALGEAARLMSGLVEQGLRTICFAKSRKAAELVHRFTAERVGPETAARLAPYRAGYTPQQRRELERRLSEGELLGVSATNALELGIDIGDLDCAISVGFPGTIASLRQQWGRAGRRRRGLAVLVASEDGLDQFFMREPDALLTRRVEAAVLDHANPRILDPHVLSAAFEAPIDEADAAVLGQAALDPGGGAPGAPTDAGGVGLGREGSPGRESVAPLGGHRARSRSWTARAGTVLGVVERERAYSTVHEGAVYLHLGEQYVVEVLDHAARTAVVRPATVDWYTQAKKETETAIVEPRATRLAAGVELVFGEISVTEQVVAYQRKAIADGSTLELVPLDLPEVTFETEAVWFSPGTTLLAGIDGMPVLLGALARRRARVDLVAPVAGDVRPVGHRWALDEHPSADGLPTVFVYDGHAGGVGITERGYARFESWVSDTASLLRGCPCRSGCPSCVQSPKCGNLNEMLDKRRRSVRGSCSIACRVSIPGRSDRRHAVTARRQRRIDARVPGSHLRKRGRAGTLSTRATARP